MILLDKLIALLERDYKFRAQGEFLRAGVCPNCGKRELYTPAKAPWVLRCGRLRKCGAEFHAKELYPELFNDWSKLYPATARAPTATADAYLREGRGFDLSKIAGWYTQESYFNHGMQEGSATVRFALGKAVAWERIIDKPGRFGNQKANFIGSYKGMSWCPPCLSGAEEEIWIVEGIFDAIALLHHGIAAIAMMSCSNYPALYLAALATQCAQSGRQRPSLVWALDADEAGRKFTRKHVARSLAEGWKATAAQPPAGREKRDWNDLHLAGRLEAEHIEKYRHAGKILLADSANEKAYLMWFGSKSTQFFFDFFDRLYWFKVDADQYHARVESYKDAGYGESKANMAAIKECSNVRCICNCLPEPLYYLTNVQTGESWYYFRVNFPHDGAAIKDTFTPAQLASLAEFKKRLLSFPGAVWTGRAEQLDHVVEQWTYNIKRVETIEFLGYSLEHGAYIFNDVAVKDGKVFKQNDEDYFELGKVAIRSLSRIKSIFINTDKGGLSKAWFGHFQTAFGAKGVIALGYWMGCLFSEQVRDRYESWPFLEIVGEPGAGKTTLLETLWKLFGRANYEGFDPMKASHVGFLRTMAQFSNLPVVLIESDREDVDGGRGRPRQQFYWDSLKSLYNGGSLRTTGVKSGGNDTNDPQFRGAMVISQNNPVQASLAIMERIVHLSFDKAHQSDDGRAAALELVRMDTDCLSGFLLSAIEHEKDVLENLDKRYKDFEKRLAQVGIVNRRVQKNYAQVMAMIDALPMVSDVSRQAANEAIALLAGLAKERETELGRDHPIVERFWEMFEYLNGLGPDGNEADLSAQLDHSRDADVIAVNLNHFVQLARDRQQQVPDVSDLKKYLPTSKRFRFVEANRTVSSAVHARLNARSDDIKRPASIRCWIFKQEKK
jgi:hypothetical protein